MEIKMVLTRTKWINITLTVLMILILTKSVPTAQPTTFFSPDMLAIQGSWVRTDAPYVIELRATKDNSLKATYFNRRFIHVENTKTAEENGFLYIMITLQDTNYPGSQYLLNYDRGLDRLNGIYILGNTKQRFKVSFTRKITHPKESG